MKYWASLSLYYVGHVCYLLGDRLHVPFMYRPYNWCMCKSFALDTDDRVWERVEE